MASKIKGQTMYLPIKPYTLSEGTGEEYNELAVSTDYDDSRKYFYVSIHAGWKSDFGHGCVIMGDNNPLSAPQYVKVKEAPKNSQKYLDQMYQNLEAGKEAIVWLFDHREWQKLHAAVCNMALCGYTEQYRKQMEELIGKTNNNNSEVMEKEPNVLKQYADLKAKHPDTMLLFRDDRYYQLFNEDAKEAVRILGINGVQFRYDPDTAMTLFKHEKLDTYLPKLIRAGKRVSICDMLPEPSGPKSKRETTTETTEDNNSNNNKNSEVMENKTNNNQESVNAANEQQVENVAVGEMTVDSIMPRMTAEPEVPTKQEVAQAISKAATEGTTTTMPRQHGTLVIASGGGEKPKPTEKKPVTLKKKTPQPAPDAEPEPDPEAVGELAGMLTRVRLFEYTTSHNEKALGIVGFSGEDDPRWKPIRDERRRLAAEYKAAKAKDPKAKAQSHPIYLSRMMDPATGGWCNTMLLGSRYMDAAKELCEAYNTDDREAWAKAVQTVKDYKTAISNGFQAERTARRAARKAEREAQNTQPATPQGKTYTEAYLADLLRRATSKDAKALAELNQIMAKAA